MDILEDACNEKKCVIKSEYLIEKNNNIRMDFHLTLIMFHKLMLLTEQGASYLICTGL